MGTKTEIKGRVLQLVPGDITRHKADALVTAANASLAGGGGVDGAIHRAAGPELLKAIQKIGGCETGSAVITDAYKLSEKGVKNVIHAVGPRWSGGGKGEPEKLKGAYETSLKLAEANGLNSIAFPSISTGVYGYPAEKAAPLALATVADFLESEASSLERVTFVLFDDATYKEYARALEEVVD